jgi:hypothetical protein
LRHELGLFTGRKISMALDSGWAYLQAALEDLKGYILSKDLYRQLPLAHQPGSAQTPQLTIGNLSLTLAYLSAQTKISSQLAELNVLQARIGAVRDEWRSNWGCKAAKEFSSRLNLWQQYLRELRGDPRGQAPYYATEVRQRAILELLRPEILEGIPAHEEQQVTLLDGVLRGLTQPGPFVWEEEVQNAFPPASYWFLYVQINK